jgi:hypothetical protein
MKLLTFILENIEILFSIFYGAQDHAILNFMQTRLILLLPSCNSIPEFFLVSLHNHKTKVL